MEYREEEDSLGVVRVPREAYYGAQTQRAADNFPISGLRFPRGFIRALGLIKKHAAAVNLELGGLSEEVARAVVQAAGETAAGAWDEQFVVDVFQTGSGTSTNMNANEVIAGRANEILTGRRGGKSPVHPNDHVNLGQSSNDVIPTCLHVAAASAFKEKLIPALEKTRSTLAAKSLEFESVKKIGRTHLQDAVVMTLGQEFGGYARQVELGIERAARARDSLLELALGGTAVGTGMNTHPGFAARVIARLAGETGLDFVEAVNHFEAQAARDAAVEAGGMLKTLAASLIKIANDVRWLGSGPRYGLGEIKLPDLQPGSSIMPGKVNPVIPEALIQVCAQVIGNDAAITQGGLGGYFELNAMLPLIIQNLLQSLDLLSAAAAVFAEKCLAGLEVNWNSPNLNLDRNLALATNLVPALGYDRAARTAKHAAKTGLTVREAALELGLLTEAELAGLLKV
ncbi:MAG: class II fumarate hydratase [Pseudomonadota bacterium]